jgi:hypothetical protein
VIGGVVGGVGGCVLLLGTLIYCKFCSSRSRGGEQEDGEEEEEREERQDVRSQDVSKAEKYTPRYDPIPVAAITDVRRPSLVSLSPSPPPYDSNHNGYFDNQAQCERIADP